MYIVQTPKGNYDLEGVYRNQRDEEIQQEELLDIRLHFHKEVTEDDLEAVARVLRSARGGHKIEVERVSLIGKYNIKNRNIHERHLIGRARIAWKGQISKRKSTLLDTPISPAETGMPPSIVTDDTAESTAESRSGTVAHSSPSPKRSTTTRSTRTRLSRTPIPRKSRRLRSGNSSI